MVYKINKKICIVCGTCELECKLGAISIGDDIKFSIDPAKCKGCSACANICPVDAITKDE